MGNKNYSKKIFWDAVDVGVNAANVWSGVRPLVVSRNKAAMGSLDEAELANKFPSVTKTTFYKP